MFILEFCGGLRSRGVEELQVWENRWLRNVDEIVDDEKSVAVRGEGSAIGGVDVAAFRPPLDEENHLHQALIAGCIRPQQPRIMDCEEIVEANVAGDGVWDVGGRWANEFDDRDSSPSKELCVVAALLELCDEFVVPVEGCFGFGYLVVLESGVGVAGEDAVNVRATGCKSSCFECQREQMLGLSY